MKILALFDDVQRVRSDYSLTVLSDLYWAINWVLSFSKYIFFIS